MKIIRRKIKFRIYNYRPRIPIKKIYWEFRKGDDDYRPCVPHGHSLEGNKADGKYKLELWTGKIYEEGTQKLYGIAKKKDMMLLFNNPEFRKFVDESRELYKQKNPKFELPPLKTNNVLILKRYLGKGTMRHIRKSRINGECKFFAFTEYDEVK